MAVGSDGSYIILILNEINVDNNNVKLLTDYKKQIK